MPTVHGHFYAASPGWIGSSIPDLRLTKFSVVRARSRVGALAGHSQGREILHGRDQLFLLHRLHQVRLKAGSRRANAIFVLRVGGERHGRSLATASALELSNLGDQRVAIRL